MTAADTLNKAVKRFLEARGYENIQSVDLSPINYLAQDEEETILVCAEIVDEDFNEANLDRKEAERALFKAAKKGLIDINVRIRFDIISVALINESNALIRHHIDCLN